MSAGSALSKRSASPVAGWVKPSSRACKAWRGNAAISAPAGPRRAIARRERAYRKPDRQSPNVRYAQDARGSGACGRSAAGIRAARPSRAPWLRNAARPDSGSPPACRETRRTTAIFLRLTALRPILPAISPEARQRHAPYRRAVGALDAARGEIFGQGAMRRFGLRGNQEAARVLVEAMHDAGPPDAADPGEARAAMRQQRVDKRPLGIAGSRMHDHSGRLVDDDQVRVLEADIERDRLRLRLGGFGFRQPYGNDLRRGWRAAPGRAKPVRRLGRRSRRGRQGSAA